MVEAIIQTPHIVEDKARDIVVKGSLVARVFGKETGQNPSWDRDYVVEFKGVRIHDLFTGDACGAINGTLEIQRDGCSVFEFDYGDAASNSAFGRESSYSRGVKVYRSGSWEQELTDLYTLADMVKDRLK